MTKIENITRDGQPAIKVSCACATHRAADVAVLTGATATALAARTGKAQSDRIHGFVTLANHPARMIQVANARKGVFPR